MFNHASEVYPPSQDFLIAPPGVSNQRSCLIATMRDKGCHPDRTDGARGLYHEAGLAG